MIRLERTFRSSDRKTDIHVLLWMPEGEIRGVLQIVHGMCEFVERYDEFAAFMAEHGYVVCANDHLGHGRSVTEEGQLGFFREKDGDGALISDMRKLHIIMKKKYPEVPYFMLGHSMGSFLVRQYMEMYAGELAGVIVMSTGSYPRAVIKFGKGLCRCRAMMKNWHYRSRFIEGIAKGSYNKAFEPVRTPYDWLSRDESIVDRFASEPLDTFTYTVNGYYSMFTVIEKAQDRKRIAGIPKDFPILLVSGTMDPVGSFTKGVKTAYNDMKKAGLSDVQMRFFEGDRHEILNELDRKEVYQYLLDWLDARFEQENGSFAKEKCLRREFISFEP